MPTPKRLFPNYKSDSRHSNGYAVFRYSTTKLCDGKMRSQIKLCASSCLSSADNSKSMIGAFMARHQNKPKKILFCLCLFICFSYVQLLVVVNRQALSIGHPPLIYGQHSINQFVVTCSYSKNNKHDDADTQRGVQHMFHFLMGLTTGIKCKRFTTGHP
jgi:hypothetical protein